MTSLYGNKKRFAKETKNILNRDVFLLQNAINTFITYTMINSKFQPGSTKWNTPFCFKSSHCIDYYYYFD